MTTNFSSDLAKLETRLNRLAATLRKPEAGVKVATRAVGNVLKKHFRAKASVLNKRGWKSQGFWGQVRSSVQESFDGAAGSVVVNDPRFLQKLYGGVIKAKRGSAIAIPLKAEFYGVSPSSFDKDRFFFLKSKKGKNVGILAEKKDDGSIKLCYVLRRQVSQGADKTALPPLSELENAAAKALRDVLTRDVMAALK